MSSILTNTGAMTALRVLGTVESQVAAGKSRLGLGLSIAGVQDDGAKYLRAQSLRGQILMQQSVGSTLSRWKSTTDVAIAGAGTVSDLINQLQEKALELQSARTDGLASRAIRKDMEDLLARIDATVDASQLSGTNLLKGTSVTKTVTRTTYSLPASTVNPSRLLAGLASSGVAAAMPPDSDETRVGGTRRLTLPTSERTPPDFEALVNPLAPQDPSYLPITTDAAQCFPVAAGPVPGRVDLLVDTGSSRFEGSSGSGVVEIWQDDVRVAASGASYAPGGTAVGPAVPAAGPFVLSFDYDPSNGTNIEIRVAAGNAGLAIEGLQLQDPDVAISEPQEHWASSISHQTWAVFDSPLTQADPEQVAAVRDDPLGDRALPQGTVAEFALDPGEAPAHIDIAFDAFDRPDTMEVWQGGVRIAATGQSARAAGAPVAEGLPGAGLSVLSFDYDPDLGPVSVLVNSAQHDTLSAWAIGAVSMRAYGSSPASPDDVVKVVSGVRQAGFGPVRYEFPTDIQGGTERIVSRDLSLRSLGLDPIDWSDPGSMPGKISAASSKVLAALTYFGAHSQALDLRQRTQSTNIDVSTRALGNLVDADLTVEAARNAALQLRAGLAMQALAIANQQPDMLLSLFRR